MVFVVVVKLSGNFSVGKNCVYAGISLLWMGNGGNSGSIDVKEFSFHSGI